MTELLTYDFMQRALLAALLVGIAAPMVGIFLVQRRLSLIGDGMGHVALAGVAVGVLTGAAPVLTALVAAVAAAVAHRADPGPRPHQRRRRAGGDVLRRHRRRRGDHRQVHRGHPGQPHVLPLRRHHHDQPRRPVGLRRARRRGARRHPWRCAPRLFAVANDEEYARASGLPVLALNVALAVLTAVTVVVVDAGRRAAADQRPDDRAQRRRPAVRAQLPRGDPLGRRWSACSSSVGGVAPRSTPTPPPAAPSCCSRSRVFAASRGHRRGLRGRLHARHHQAAERHDARARRRVRPPRRRARRPRRLPARRAPARAARAATTTSTSPAGHDAAPEPQQRQPARATTGGGEHGRPTVRRADPAARRGRRRCSATPTTSRSAQDLHARLRGAGQTVGPGHGLPHPAGDGRRRRGRRAAHRRRRGRLPPACSHRPPPPPASAARAGAPSRSRARPSSAGPTRSRRARLRRRAAHPGDRSAPARTARPADAGSGPRVRPARVADGPEPSSGVDGAAVAAVARGVDLDRPPEVAAVEVGPERVVEHHLGVGRLPEQEVAGALLPRATARTGRRRACRARRGSARSSARRSSRA